MSTNFHTPISPGDLVTAESVNGPLGTLDQGITDLQTAQNPTANLIITPGTWDGRHIVIGNGHLFVNGTSLMWKGNGPPTGPTDGIDISDRP